MIEHPDNKDLQEAKDWASSFIHGEEKYFILDTETTGLDDAEIIDICVMTRYGQPLLNTLVKPSIPIPPVATHIHGITDQMVADAPTFPDIYPKLKQLIEGKKVIIYNEAFDCNIIRYCCELHNLPPIRFYSSCAMLWYAQYYGDWHDYYGNYKWQKLPGGGEHRALADCQAVYRLLQKMGQREYTKPEIPCRQFPPLQVACKWEEMGLIDLRWKNKNGFYHVAKLHIKLPFFGLLKDGKFLNRINEQEPDIPDIDDVPF